MLNKKELTLDSVLRCVSKKYDFVNMNNGNSNIYEYNTYAGEDAWFITQNSIGVSDGVSGWNIKGLSSAFSNSLMLECKSHLKISNNPKVVLEMAYEITKKNVIGGSATACIAILHDDEISVANHGDSGLIIIRNNNIIYKTSFDQMEDDTPYQLGKWEFNDTNVDDEKYKQIVTKLYNQKGRRNCDTKLYNFKVEVSDLIILATDGFFNYISDEEILKHCNSIDVANDLIKQTISNVVSKNNIHCIDDITIIVSKVIEKM
jgi:serine/threonine protein phosphatase PrpC